MSSPPLSRLHQRKRYSREEVDGVRKEKERLTTDHQPREIIDGRLTFVFLYTIIYLFLAGFLLPLRELLFPYEILIGLVEIPSQARSWGKRSA